MSLVNRKRYHKGSIHPRPGTFLKLNFLLELLIRRSWIVHQHHMLLITCCRTNKTQSNTSSAPVSHIWLPPSINVHTFDMCHNTENKYFQDFMSLLLVILLMLLSFWKSFILYQEVFVLSLRILLRHSDSYERCEDFGSMQVPYSWLMLRCQDIVHTVDEVSEHERVQCQSSYIESFSWSTKYP